jgi:hypothetical protein
VSSLKSQTLKYVLAVLVAVALGVVLTSVAIFLMSDALSQLVSNPSPARQATATAVSILTTAHEDEARAAIESEFLVSGSLDARLHPEIFAQVATGPRLDVLHSFGIPESDDTVYVGTAIELSEVHVLEYDESGMKVVGCGTTYHDEVTAQGDFVQSNRPVQGTAIYVFLWEDETWKLATLFGLDEDNLNYMLPYMSQWEREALGDVEGYMWTYFGCGLND